MARADVALPETKTTLGPPAQEVSESRDSPRSGVLEPIGLSHTREVPVAFSIPQTSIRLTFSQRVVPTGASVPLLFVATDGTRTRGVRILISDVLLWSLEPKPKDEQLPLVAAQLGKSHVAAAIAASGVDAFFAGQGDLDVWLRSENSPSEWNLERQVD